MSQLNSLLISKLTPRQIQAQDEYLQRLELNPFEALLEETNYRELAFQKLENLIKYGITAQEFQDLVVVLLVLRFVIYSIKYNPITSFKLCCIGGFSAYLWLTVFFNHTTRYMALMPNNLFMANMFEEQMEDYTTVFLDATQRGIEDATKWSIARQDINDLPFWSVMRFKILVADNIIPLPQQMFALIPQSIITSMEPLYSFFSRNLFPLARRFYSLNSRSILGMISYTFIVRINKVYCPYHVRWHYTYVIIHSQLSNTLYETLLRAQMYVINVLLPTRQFDEAETVSIYIGVTIWLHLACLMLATLHALFSQYFFIPIISEAVELHIGPRPKRSIWSGGYTAWQDQPAFYKRRFNIFGDSTRLWWGWLGRGVDKPPPKKKKKRKKKK
jgi:hypothetical protein